MNEKAIELAKKLKALADKGTGGEKENAQVLLERFLKQHDITLEELELDAEDWYPFTVSKEQMQIFIVLVAHVCSLETRYIPGKKVQILCTMTKALELEAKFDFYWRAYTEELDVFKRAFVMKNELWANGTWEGKEMTPEQKAKHEEEARRARLMALGLNRQQYLKQLPNHNS